MSIPITLIQNHRKILDDQAKIIDAPPDDILTKGRFGDDSGNIGSGIPTKSSIADPEEIKITAAGTFCALVVLAALALPIYFAVNNRGAQPLVADDQIALVSSQIETYVTKHQVNVRAEPTAQGSVAGTLSPGTRFSGYLVRNIQSSENWVRFRASNGRILYVWANGLAKKQTKPAAIDRLDAIQQSPLDHNADGPRSHRPALPQRVISAHASDQQLLARLTAGAGHLQASGEAGKARTLPPPLIKCFVPDTSGRAPSTLQTTKADCFSRHGLEASP